MEQSDCCSDEIQTASTTTQSGLDIDPGKYRPLLDGIDISDAQADELLLIIRDIMVMMISLNVPAESWGQITDSIILPPDADSVGLDS